MSRNDRHVLIMLFSGIVGVVVALTLSWDTLSPVLYPVTNDEVAALVAEELGLSPKHITYEGNGKVKTINGDYRIDFAEDKNGEYGIKTIVKD